MLASMSLPRTAWFAAISACLLAPATLRAQLTPERRYYGVNRPIPMRVAAPENLTGEVEILLMKPGANGSPDASVIQRASAEAGRVDLSGLFPILWTTEQPELLYAQLAVGGERLGPAVVLQPMLKPRIAQQQGRTVRFSPPDTPPCAPTPIDTFSSRRASARSKSRCAPTTRQTRATTSFNWSRAASTPTSSSTESCRPISRDTPSFFSSATRRAPASADRATSSTSSLRSCLTSSARSRWPAHPTRTPTARRSLFASAVRAHHSSTGRTRRSAKRCEAPRPSSPSRTRR